jgi:hypothetical protein
LELAQIRVDDFRQQDMTDVRWRRDVEQALRIAMRRTGLGFTGIEFAHGTGAALEITLAGFGFIPLIG